MAQIQAFLQHSGIPYHTPDSSEFTTFQSSVTGSHDDVKPSIITLPQTGSQVAAIVTQCIDANMPLVVRGSGHDMFGRFSALGAVSIDMRNLSSVNVSPDKKTARIGGGTKSLRVLEALSEQGLQAAVGSCSDVGFVGWSLVAGFGPYADSYGLGVDQIVGATVVNAQGKLVEADEGLLKGLRGGGGCLGVVVELTVKVYPKGEIQAGMWMLDSTDMEKTVTTFFNGYNDLIEKHGKQPSLLTIMPIIFVLPGLGPTLSCCFIWNGPATDETRTWLDRFASLGTPMANNPKPQDSVKAMDFVSWSKFVQNFVPPVMKGRTQGAAASHFSPAVIACVAQQAAVIPTNGSGGINIHILGADSPSCRPPGQYPESVCAYRQPHLMIELLGFGGDDVAARDASAWALESRNKLMVLEDALPITYLSLTAPEFTDAKAVYGDKWEELRQLKREYDPNNVFSNTIPRVV